MWACNLLGSHGQQELQAHLLSPLTEGNLIRCFLVPLAQRYLRKCDTLAICALGSRVDVCVRQSGQVRKEAATTDCGGSPGSFSPDN